MLNINTNIASLTAQNNLSGSQSALSQAINRLSSGKRVNTAADDAAGLAISTSQTASINALTQGAANANNGISMVQTTNGALQSIVDNLQRIRQLAVEAGDGSLDSNALANLQSEVSTRLTEITRVAQQTTFNGQSVLNGIGSVNFQIGAFNGQQITVSTASGAQAAMSTIDTVLTSVNTFQATLGATQNTFSAAISTTNTQATNMSAARSQITDADFATETANLSKAQVLQQAGISVLAQANSMPQQVLKLLQ
jgi:flagellin